MDTKTFSVRLHNDDSIWMPEKAHDTDAGFDLKARAVCPVIDCKVQEEIELREEYPHYLNYRDIVLVKTGVFLALSEGWEAQIRPRSGMALKYGVTVVNSPGTIDADYRAEIGVILQNRGSSRLPYLIGYQQRIAQMVIKKVPSVLLKQVASLDQTIRGEGGFGSTGE